MSKVTTYEAVMANFKDGQTIMVGGFMTVGSPETLMDALLASGARDLTIICNDGGIPGKGTGKLVASKVISDYIASHIGLNPQLGQQMNAGQVNVTLVPQGTLAEQIRCGGAGLGGVLTPTGVGTLVEKGKELIQVNGKTYLLETPLKGDIALIKAHRSDRNGNLVFRKSARNFNPLMAPACAYVIAEVEHIEDTGTIDPDHVMLPGIYVDAIVPSNYFKEESS